MFHCFIALGLCCCVGFGLSLVAMSGSYSSLRHGLRGKVPCWCGAGPGHQAPAVRMCSARAQAQVVAPRLSDSMARGSSQITGRTHVPCIVADHTLCHQEVPGVRLQRLLAKLLPVLVLGIGAAQDLFCYPICKENVFWNLKQVKCILSIKPL